VKTSNENRIHFSEKREKLFRASLSFRKLRTIFHPINVNKYSNRKIYTILQNRAVWRVIIMGQFLSLVLCFMTLVNHHINTASYKLSLPTGNSFIWRSVLRRSISINTRPSCDGCWFSLKTSPLIDNNRFREIGQNLPHYVMMCLVYTTWMSCRGVGNGLISVIRARGWRYLLMALIDVEACTLITSSHQFTSLASIQVCAGLEWCSGSKSSCL